MTEQPGDGEDALALSECEGSVRMAQVMQAHIGEVRLHTDPAPEVAQPHRACRPGAGRREGKTHAPLRSIASEHVPSPPPDSHTVLGPDFESRREQPPLTVVGPAQGEHLAPAAPGEQNQPHRRHLKRPLRLVRRERPGKAANLRIGQEPLAPPCARVAPDAPAGIGPLGAVAHALGLCQDDRQHGHGAVGGHGRCAQRGEPALDILGGPMSAIDCPPNQGASVQR